MFSAFRDHFRSVVIGVAIIALTTTVADVLQDALRPRDLALVFMAAIAGVGAAFGLHAAVAASLSAFVLYNFYLVEPRYALALTPADLLTLLTFLGAALLVGWLSGRLSDKARTSKEQVAALSTLFQASRDFSAASQPREAARELSRRLAVHGGPCALWLAEQDGYVLATTANLDAARIPRRLGAKDRGPILVGDTPYLLEELKTQRGTVGLILSNTGLVDTLGGDTQVADTLLDLAAIAIERAQLMREIAEAQVIVEREGLRTALLSSLSHDLRTPLATIIASTSSLLLNDASFDADTRVELVQGIQDEAERLNRYVGHLLEMTRVEAGVVHVRWSLVEPHEAMTTALERLRRVIGERSIVVECPAASLLIEADPLLLEQTLVNLIENAILHTDPGVKIKAGAYAEDGDCVLFVEDEGRGIEVNELGRVFDKFFRGRSDRRGAAGVGLGLAVARGLTEAMHGRISATSPGRGGKGARFEIRFRAQKALDPIE